MKALTFIANSIASSIASRAYFAHETDQLTTLSLHKVPPSPGGLIGGLPGSSGGLTGSTRVGAYHTTNKLLFHVGPAIYKLLGGVLHVICVFYI